MTGTECKKCGNTSISITPVTGLCLMCDSDEEVKKEKSNKTNLKGLSVNDEGQVVKKEEPKKLGMKFDDEKIDITLVPAIGIEQIAKLSMVGLEKYARDNWKKVPDGFKKYVRALLRHALKLQKAVNNGEDVMTLLDDDTGMSEFACIACNAFYALWFIENEGKIDDETWKIKKKEMRKKYKKQRDQFLKGTKDESK